MPRDRNRKNQPPPPPRPLGQMGGPNGMGVVAGDMRTLGIPEPEVRSYAGDAYERKIPLALKINTLAGSWRCSLFLLCAAIVLPISLNTALRFDYQWLMEDENWGQETQGIVEGYERAGPQVDGHSTLEYRITFTAPDGSKVEGTSFGESANLDHEKKGIGWRAKWRFVGPTIPEFKKGDAVRVRFNPDDYSRNAIHGQRRAAETKEDLLAWLFIASALFFFWWRWRYAKRLWRALTNSKQMHAVVKSYPQKWIDDTEIQVRLLNGELLETEVSLSKAQIKKQKFDPANLHAIADVGHSGKIIILDFLEPKVAILNDGTIATKSVWYRAIGAFAALIWPLAALVVVVMWLLG